ncbi:PhnE/PtxC family ABC transporter permease [Leptothermofonsia sp. ETS-13]|uniref:PhnE/PtxC family ABC transporter permease n=1 Tax=Leptothermofonsia sp. ETS-13 TaxID=3035696 RepID=UPI003B9ED472
MTSDSLQSQRPSPLKFWIGVAVGAIAIAFWQTGIFQRELFNHNGFPQFWRFVSASVHPDLSPELLQLTWSATLKTLAYAVCGTCFSVVLGLIGGILCSEVWWESVFRRRAISHQGRRFFPYPLLPTPHSLFLIVRAALAIPRAIHELIWGLIFVNLFGLDPLVAVLAIAVPFGAITAKVFSELLDETPRQPLLALLNSGVAPLPAFFYSLLPQSFLNLLSYSFYRFECSIRSAAVLGIIGAGGLGYEIMLSLQSLRYEQLWTFFYALFTLNGCVDFVSAWLRQRLGCASRLDLNWKKNQKAKIQNLSRTRKPEADTRQQSRTTSPVSPTPHLPFASHPELKTQNSKFKTHPPIHPSTHLPPPLLPIVLTIFSFWYVGADFTKLWQPVTWHRLVDILQSCLPPDWEVASQLVKLSGQTVSMSVLAIALAGIGATFLAFPAAHNFFLPGGLLNPGRANLGSRLWAWVVLLVSRAILLMCRAIPAPIWALVVLYILFPGILPGAIALGLHNLGILGRLKAEVIENLDFRPLEALKGQGAPPMSVFLYGVLPLTLPRFLAYDLYRWEVCMRETVIVGLVGAGGLGRVLMEQLSSFDYRGMVVTLGGFVLLTFLVDWLSAVARRSLR